MVNDLQTDLLIHNTSSSKSDWDLLPIRGNFTFSFYNLRPVQRRLHLKHQQRRWKFWSEVSSPGSCWSGEISRKPAGRQEHLPSVELLVSIPIHVEPIDKEVLFITQNSTKEAIFPMSKYFLPVIVFATVMISMWIDPHNNHNHQEFLQVREDTPLTPKLTSLAVRHFQAPTKGGERPTSHLDISDS